jgi:Fe2+ transport system protein FeoA
MSSDTADDNQIVFPPSLIALFVPPDRIRPTKPREHVAQRYELCEDIAQMLTETARARLLDLGITESDVLERTRRGLVQAGSVVSIEEVHWVVRRLAKLMDWPDPRP